MPDAAPIRAVLAASLVLAGGCTALIDDSAVRLARCIERGAARLEAGGAAEIREECDLRVGGPAKVLAFPPTAVSSARLRAEGLTDDDIGTINLLQMGDGPYARLNVLPAGRRTRPSHTTYHRRFVETPELLVCQPAASRVSFLLRRQGSRIVLQELAAAPAAE